MAKKINMASAPAEKDYYALIPEGIYTITKIETALNAEETMLFVTMTAINGLKFATSLTDEDKDGVDDNGKPYTIESNFKKFFAGLKAQLKLPDETSVTETVAIAKTKDFKVLNKHYTAKSSGNVSNQFSTSPRVIERFARNSTATAELA